jgi:hypothetical protein
LAILLPSLALSCHVIFEGLRPRIAKVPLAIRPFGDPSPISGYCPVRQCETLAILLPSLALSCHVIFVGLRPRFAKVPLAIRPFGDPSPIISFILSCDF